ncbi:hypothetical protein [Bradyrhizobium sp. Ash2021]|uniref:hypothetical protein n=1 Tax=Bradyrhizobium sp. Ash2021 TaxID=2954771 RepID=UPI0028154653|nr:hypothetical protein [Bradyrhizobium sp. Ash2021]WMT72560.1 hypothetical protein NL528_31675 [Bradyrhizobium sp. Ash2021]
MQQFFKLARSVSSPAILVTSIWCAIVIGVAIGPIDYPQQPSAIVLAVITLGVLLFVSGHQAGIWCFSVWLRHRSNFPASSAGVLHIAVASASLVGVAGIALIAVDRVALSGVINGGYSELLRCAPDLVDSIEIKRTPLIYVGYLTFSFAYAALALFLLKGEEFHGWVAYVAQLSIVSPVGYALLYSGRMPILFMIMLIVSTGLVRIRQGRSILPRGHYLLAKMVVFLLLFGIYTNAMWSSRRNFCIQMSGVIQELQLKDRQKKSEQMRDYQQHLAEAGKSRSALIDAADLSSMIERAKPSRDAIPPTRSAAASGLLSRMEELWYARPRAYVLQAVESGRLSSDAAIDILSTYFYLTHGVRIIDTVWHARQQLSPHWGAYEIGVLSPILRVFAPNSQWLTTMTMQLKSTQIYGFFPTVWAAAFIDFGAIGSIIYILIWGFAAGWSDFRARTSELATPPLLLTFILASIFLSPIQGPLGIANSALVLCSMVALGMAVDLATVLSRSRRLEPGISSA